MNLSYPDQMVPIAMEHFQAIDALPMPSVEDLTFLINLAFFASMEKEEGQPLRFSIVYLEEKALSSRPDYFWSPITFENPRPATVSEIAKLALSTDPRCVHIALIKRDGVFMIGGLVRAGMDRYRMDRNETSSGGDIVLWHSRIQAHGPGKLTIGSHGVDLLDFASGELLPMPINVLSTNGIIRRAIFDFGASNFSEFATQYFVRIIGNLLQRIADKGHGGTLVIVPDAKSCALMNRKYATSSKDLKLQFERYAQSLEADFQMNQELFDRSQRIRAGESLDAEELAKLPYRASAINAALNMDSTRIYDVIDSVASHTLVDGALVINSTLEILAIGAMFPWKEDGIAVERAADAEAKSIEPFDLTKLGSRHRSAAWFCSAVPGAIAFVLSADGGISCMHRTLNGEFSHSVILWRPVSLSWIDRDMQKRTYHNRNELTRKRNAKPTRIIASQSRRP
jgi:hypothetical protein